MHPLFSFSNKIPIHSPYSTPSIPICPALRSCRTSPFSASFSVPIRPRNPAAAKGKTALPHNGMTIGTDYE